MSLINRSSAYEQEFEELNEDIDIESEYEIQNDYEQWMLEEQQISNHLKQ